MVSRPSFSSFTKKEIEKLYKGAKFRTEWFDVIFSPKNKDFARILIVTSKKIGNAPKRNKLKRRIRSIFFEEKLFNSGSDCIFIAKKLAINLTFKELKDLLISIYKNKILNENIR